MINAKYLLIEHNVYPYCIPYGIIGSEEDLINNINYQLEVQIQDYEVLWGEEHNIKLIMKKTPFWDIYYVNHKCITIPSDIYFDVRTNPQKYALIKIKEITDAKIS